MKSVDNQPEYQGQTNPPSAEFPQGSFKDDPNPGQGTPFVAITENKLQALIQRVFQEAGVSPNGVDDTVSACQLYDVMQAVLNLAANMAVDELPTLGLGANNLQAVLNAFGNGAVSTRQTSATDATANRLLTPGAFGLGGSCVTVTNFNTLDKTGFYYGIGGATTGSPNVNGAHWVLHFQAGGTGADCQMAVSQDNGAVYHRIKKGGASNFEPWLADGEPTASILESASSNTPPGYLPTDGAAVSRDTYVVLFEEIGTSFGAGDGSTTFNVPNKTGAPYFYYIKY